MTDKPSNEDQRKDAERLGLGHDSLYKRGLERAAAYNLIGTESEVFAKDYVTGVIQEKVEIAKRMLAMNIDITLIAKGTGLKESVLKKL